jgi:hypothetical protein
MKKGTYNKLYQLSNMVIKISSVDSMAEQYLFDKINTPNPTKKIKAYEQAVSDLGIKTAKIYFVWKLFNKIIERIITYVD